MKSLLTLLGLVLLPALGFAGATSSPPPWTFPGLSNTSQPIIFFVKNLSAATVTVPVDLATIPIPPGITRWKLAVSGMSYIIGETGICSGAQFSMFDQSGGAGNIMAGGVISGPAGATGANSLFAIAAAPTTSAQGWSTSSSLVLRQTQVSTLPGTFSIYICIIPLN